MTFTALHNIIQPDVGRGESTPYIPRNVVRIVGGNVGRSSSISTAFRVLTGNPIPGRGLNRTGSSPGWLVVPSFGRPDFPAPAAGRNDKNWPARYRC